MSEAFVKLDFACNQKCLFCCTSDDKESLSTGQAKALIEKYVKEMQYDSVVFTGGEPTIRDDLIELVKFSKNLGAEVKLQTNGVVLHDKDYVSKLVQAGLTKTLVSIHSFNEETNDFITQVPGSLKKSLTGIKNFIDNKVQVHIGYVITSKNTDLVGFVKFIKQKFPEINFFLFFLAWPFARGWRNRQYTPRLKDIETNLKEVFDYCAKNGVDFSTRGIPLCYMRGVENHSSETQGLLSDEKPMVINDYKTLEPKHSFEETNVKEPCCDFCKLNHKCGGIWKHYSEVHKNQLWPLQDETR